MPTTEHLPLHGLGSTHVPAGECRAVSGTVNLRCKPVAVMITRTTDKLSLARIEINGKPVSVDAGRCLTPGIANTDDTWEYPIRDPQWVDSAEVTVTFYNNNVATTIAIAGAAVRLEVE